MPYVKIADRIKPNYLVDKMIERHYIPQTAGDLNYLLTSIVLTYLHRNGDPRYADYNEAIGVLECAKLELYARAIRPYEDRKKVENGDVYE